MNLVMPYRQLHEEELGKLSFTHSAMLRYEDGVADYGNRASWAFDFNKRVISVSVESAALMTEPLVFFGDGAVRIKNWVHLEVFRHRPSGWMTETRRPPNPLAIVHKIQYESRYLLIYGKGAEPPCKYLLYFDLTDVEARFRELPDQELLRARYEANMQKRRSYLTAHPDEAEHHWWLDEADRGFLASLAVKADETSSESL